MESLWKKNIRREMMEKRNKLTTDDVQELSKNIINTLIKLPPFIKSKNVMLYLSLNNEVDSLSLLEYCQNQGKNIIIPYYEGEDETITLVRIDDLDIDLHKHITPVELDDIDIIIIPGIAFDKRCYRIGYGSGYYDRILTRANKKTTKIGVAFDFQIICTAHVEDFDIPLDYVVTEKRIIVR